MIYFNSNGSKGLVNIVRIRKKNEAIANNDEGGIGDITYSTSQEDAENMYPGLYMNTSADSEKVLLILKDNGYSGGSGGQLIVQSPDGNHLFADVPANGTAYLVVDTLYYTQREGAYKGKILLDGFSINVSAVELP